MTIRDLIIGSVSTVPQLLPLSSYPTIRIGSTGDVVKRAAALLDRVGLQWTVNDSKVGLFDEPMEAAVKQFQVQNNLLPSGIIDSPTWAKLRSFEARTQVGATSNIKDIVSNMEVSLSLDGVSQISFDVPDPGLVLSKNNYWNIRREVKFQEMTFEIASVEIRQGEGGETVRIEARNAACQKLKRDKNATVFTGGNGTAYAAMKAKSVGLKFFGESSTEQKNISQSSSDSTNESSWDVMKRIAGQNQFIMFESDGRLFFCTMQFLLGKFGLVADASIAGFFATNIYWLEDIPQTESIPAPSGNPTLRPGDTGDHVKFVQRVLKLKAGQSSVFVNGVFDTATKTAITNLQSFFRLPVTGICDNTTWATIRYLGGGINLQDAAYGIRPLECPNLRKSDDDSNAATLSIQVDQEVGVYLRPGMTIRIVDIPDFKNDYIVTEVRWNEGTPDAVAVTARTPVEPQDATKAAELAKRVDLTGGGYSSIAVDNIFA